MKWELPTSHGGVFAYLYVWSFGAKQATPADLIACLRASPAERMTVLRAFDEDLDRREVVHEQALRSREHDHAAAVARAESAERSLSALRDQVEHSGCAASHLGERVYNCRTESLCGLCRLRHRAEQAERSRDEWRAKWENLETHRAVCCDQMERERDALQAKLAEAERSFAGYNAKLHAEALRENDVLRARLTAAETLLADAQPFVHEAARNYGPPEAKAWLRALDAAQAKDSGGSGRIPGSATREAAHASSSGPEPGPEPAGTTQAAERFLDEWNRLSAVRRATMRETFPALHAAFVAAFPPHTAQPFGHISKADECQLDSPVGVAATAEGPGPGPLCAQCGAPIGYCRTVCAREVERSVSNGQTPEPTGTTRREPPETDRQDGSTGAVACSHPTGRFNLRGDEVCDHCGTRTALARPPDDATVIHFTPGKPLTPADLDALEERIVERVARACDAAQDAPRDWGKPEPGSLECLADELRRKP